MQTQPYGPNERPDAAPPHENPIRRFREELRLSRADFAELIGENQDTLRNWETTGKSKPRPEKGMKLVALAQKNNYPLTLEDIYPDES